MIRDRACRAIRDDTQSRYIEAAVNGILIACLYLPNGNPQPGPKFDYKLKWFERLQRARREASCKQDVPVVLAGDYNVAPTDPTSIRPSPGTRTRCCSRRAARLSQRCSQQGWTDAIRTLHPTSRCTRSGTTSEIAGGAMPACGSIICC